MDIFDGSVPSSDVTTDDPQYTDVMKKITEVVGSPKNYGLSPEEQEEVNRQKEEERKQKLAAEAAEKKRRNEATLAEMAAQYDEWVCQEKLRLALDATGYWIKQFDNVSISKVIEPATEHQCLLNT